jgi:hypothetical protein
MPLPLIRVSHTDHEMLSDPQSHQLLQKRVNKIYAIRQIENGSKIDICIVDPWMIL